MLKNRYGLDGLNEPFWKKENWKNWNFNSGITAKYIYINNTKSNRVLAASSNGKVSLEVFKEDKRQQLWLKEIFYDPSANGYFMLKNPENSKKVLTAATNWLEMKGNIYTLGF